MTVQYWSDYNCPFCYIGETRFKKAMAEFPELKDVPLEFKAFELDPSAPEKAEGEIVTLMAKKYGVPEEVAARQIQSITAMGAEEGLDMRYATAKSTNSMDAHRLTKYAREQGPETAEKLITALYDAYFTRNLELADPEILCSIGEDCGLDPAEIRQVLQSDRYRQEVLQDEREAARYGIRAVPFFLIGKYGVSGAQPVEIMREAIRKAMEDSGEFFQDPGGAACSGESCSI